MVERSDEPDLSQIDEQSEEQSEPEDEFGKYVHYRLYEYFLD